VPLVRATGGLDDTIVDFATAKSNLANGFKFTEYSSSALLDKLKQAYSLYADRTKWNQLALNGMACDFSWDVSARRYIELYQKAIERKSIEETAELKS
jgi:starch synthase